MAKSFLERVQPSRQRWKVVKWPFPTDDGCEHTVRVRVLGQNETEAAYLAAADHFKKAKRTLPVTDPAFAMREHTELVFRAYSYGDGMNEPIADDVDELAKQPMALIDELYNTWAQFQADVCAVPHTAKEMDALVEHLKKNGQAAQLVGLPSSWLIACITTLADRLFRSTPESEAGS